MKKIVAFSIIVLHFLSCSRVIEIEIPPVKADPSGAVLGAKVVESGEGRYVFEVDIHLVDDRGLFISNIRQDNFSIDYPFNNPDFSFSLLNLQRGLKTDFRGNYDAMFLMDQSGSISGNDPSDSRITAANFFLDNLGAVDRVGLSSFSGSNFRINIPMGRELDAFRNELDILGRTEGGGTPLYFSTYEMINYVAQNAQGNNKALVIFTDGEDTNGRRSPSEIINRANELGVNLYTVGLGSSLSNLDVLSQMAEQTNGYFMLASDAEQLISYFGSLGNLLQGNANFYRLRWEATTSTPLVSQRTYLMRMEIALSPVKTITVPFSVVLP